MPATRRASVCDHASIQRRRPKVAAAPPPPHESAAEAGLRYVSDTQPGDPPRARGHGLRLRRPGRQSASPTRSARADPTRSPSRRPTPTSGSVPDPTDTSRPPGGTRGGASSTAITPAGARCGTRPSSAACSPSARRCRGSARGSMRPPRSRGCPARRCWRRWSGCSSAPLIRVGNDEYARSNRSFGLTTLRDRHVEVSGGDSPLQFRGKSGKTHEVELTDRRLARIVAALPGRPGEELFQYLDDAGPVRPSARATSTTISGRSAGRSSPPRTSAPGRGRCWRCGRCVSSGRWTPSARPSPHIIRAMDQVAEQLNNTRAVCRKYYIHPTVLEDSTSPGRC